MVYTLTTFPRGSALIGLLAIANGTLTEAISPILFRDAWLYRFGPGVGLADYLLRLIPSFPIVALGAFLSAELTLLFPIPLYSLYWSGPGMVQDSTVTLSEFPMVALGPFFIYRTELVS